jgi:hypothetical protein
MSINIAKVEEKYQVKYIGFYDIPGRDELYVFYQANPRTDLGHSNYLGVFVRYMSIISPGMKDEIWLTDGKRILEAKYPARICEDNFILCSRYRHDYVTHGNAMLDGGLDYTRCHPGYPPNGYVRIVSDREEFVYYEDAVTKGDLQLAN